ncbi:unnamed protein product [Phytomonas sp. Hart1]|nr:unnamed protein product [Phytomonas sp. Hart1]|eukprot:CCW69568.1 unnamed protein product [Phytomonas sp. isolate Hart1]
MSSGPKIVFLDCDGVISPFSGPMFSKVHMQRLKKIVDTAQAKIVLSSSWRTSEFGRKEVKKQLIANGISSFIDCTPSISNRPRVVEILTWLENHENLNVKNFLALDDINLTALAPNKTFFAKHSITTNGLTGLTDQDVAKAIEILSDRNNINKKSINNT